MSTGAPRHPLKWLVALGTITIVVAAFLLMSLARTNEGIRQGYLVSRSDLNQTEFSINLAYALVHCGQYSNHAGVISLSELNTLPNDQPFTSRRALQSCDESTPSYAPENGFSFLIAAALAVGADTPATLAVALTSMKYALIAAAGFLALPLVGGIAAAVITLGVAAWAFHEELYFYDARLLIDYHVIEPYVWLLSAMLCANVLVRLFRGDSFGLCGWASLAVAVGGLFFLRLFRISNFYIEEVAVLAAGLATLWFIFAAKRKLLQPAAIVAILVVSPMLLGIAHSNWIKERSCAAIGGDRAACDQMVVNIEHPILHPIVLGLAVPPSPISDRFGFEWANDTETLKPAQFINPQVDKLYTPEFTAALRDFYVHIWTQHTNETVSTYLTKFSVLYGVGWPVTILSIVALGAALWFRNTAALFFALLFFGKSLESILIYTHYTPFFHQSAGVMAIVAAGALVAKRSYFPAQFTPSA